MPNNGDTDRIFNVDGEKVRGLGSFHKTLPHNKFGEVHGTQLGVNAERAFKQFVKATRGEATFNSVPQGPKKPGDADVVFTNPQGGMAEDQLTNDPHSYKMAPAPKVLSQTTATEMTEIYWMAKLRDVGFDMLQGDPEAAVAANELSGLFAKAVTDRTDAGRLKRGIDIPGSESKAAAITPQNLFRLGLPGEEIGPLISQFLIRDVGFGTQTIDQKQLPYASGMDYLTLFEDWLHAQNSGSGNDGNSYSGSNEKSDKYYEETPRYISTMRDMARFVNKDALHQAYFNAALVLMNGKANWNPGNPYVDKTKLGKREAGFGTLGGPHILALVSEVATRALKIVWYQKWQENLRLRPEAYGGLVHVENIGVGTKKRGYGLPDWVAKTCAAEAVRAMNKSMNKKGEDSLLLPMAFTAGSPAHPAYGAGHATVAGACVTVLKAYFQTLEKKNGSYKPVPLIFHKTDNKIGLIEKGKPFDPAVPFTAYITGKETVGTDECGTRKPLHSNIANSLTIEGELNKLATNVAMGRTMGGVHWRTDNTRSLMLGEAIAAEMLADITNDVNENVNFTFRTFRRNTSNKPEIVIIKNGKVRVGSKNVRAGSSML